MKLKRCPFCDGEAGIAKTNKTKTGEKFAVGCMFCGIELPFAYDSEEEATKRWNTRFENQQGRVIDIESL